MLLKSAYRFTLFFTADFIGFKYRVNKFDKTCKNVIEKKYIYTNNNNNNNSEMK